MRKTITASLAALVASAALPAASAEAQEAGEWTITVNPYLLAPAMNGDAAIRGIDAEVDISRKDIISELNIGFLGYLEAHNGQFGFGVDTNYMNLDATDDDAIIAVNTSQLAVQPMAFYRVAPQLDLMVGARYNNLKLDFESDFETFDGSRKKDWIDPIVGVRFQSPVSSSVGVSMLANIGGFGVGSDIAVQLRPMFHFGIADNITLDAGYQLVYMDYEDGAENGRFAYDVLNDGPIFGATFTF